MYISEETINQIRERADVVDVIGEYVNLKASGNNFKGLCPFHTEKTPSFIVNPQKGIFHCFGCGVGGNVFNFLMKFKGVSFPDAVRLLGMKVGIRVETSGRSEIHRSKTEGIFTMNKHCVELFKKNLQSTPGEAARRYLQIRNIDQETITDFHIGFALNSWDSLFTHMKSQGFDDRTLEEAGLIVKRKNSPGYYDRFRNRIIFPIQDNIGRFIGFGARTLEDGVPEIPKYINSSENVLFHKGRYLYGLYNAEETIRKRGHAFVVEGYIDVIKMYVAGLKNTVAPLGTSLTADQISLIMRFTRNIYLVFDPDEAGQKATLRSISLFHAKDIDPLIVRLPHGVDPGDFFNRYTAEEFELLVDEAVSGIAFIVDYFAPMNREYTANEKIVLLRSLVEYYGNMENDILRDDFVAKVSKRLTLNENIIKREMNKRAPRARSSLTIPSKKKEDKAVYTELYLLLLILNNPSLFPIAEKRIDESYFHGKWTKRLWNAIERAQRHENWDSALVFTYLDDERFIEYVSKKLISESFSINPKEQIIDVIASLKERRIRQQIAEINSKLEKAELENNEDIENQLIIEKGACINELEKVKVLRSSKTRL